MTRAPLLVLAMACAACGAETIVAGADDYGLYRKTRVEKTLERRLAAAEEYLARFPHGAYLDRVKSFHDEAEPPFFTSSRGSIAGLEHYVETLPRGPHEKMAADELAAKRREAEAEREATDALAHRAGSAIDRESGARQRLKKETSAWIHELLDPEVFERPLVDAKPELLEAWSLALPEPRCRLAPKDARRGAFYVCSKILELPFNVVVNGKREPREAALEVRITYEEDGTPMSAWIGGTDLFVRMEEARTAAPIDANDASARIDAIAAAVELAREVAAPRLGDLDKCAHAATGAKALILDCGVHFEVKAGLGEDDDGFFIAPIK